MAQKAYQTLVEQLSVAEWVAEGLKEDATPILRGFVATAIIDIQKKKPSDQNAQDAVPFIAAATVWNRFEGMP